MTVIYQCFMYKDAIVAVVVSNFEIGDVFIFDNLACHAFKSVVKVREKVRKSIHAKFEEQTLLFKIAKTN